MVRTVNVNVQAAFAPPVHGWLYANRTSEFRQASGPVVGQSSALKTHVSLPDALGTVPVGGRKM
jgi:hypothetical protein